MESWRGAPLATLRRSLSSYVTGSSETANINSAFLRAIEKRTSAAHFVALMLDLCGVDIKITEQAVIATASHISDGENIMTLLLNHSTDAQLMKKLISTAIGNKDFRVDIIKLLLDCCSMGVHIIQKVVTTTQWETDRRESLMALLNRCSTDPLLFEEVVMAITPYLRNDTTLPSLGLRSAEFQMTEELVIAYIGCAQSVKIMSLLLNYREADMSITKNVLRAILEHPVNAGSLLKLFAKYKKNELAKQLTEDMEYSSRIEVLTARLRRIRVKYDWVYFKN